jgi:hypothetical protein
MKHLLSIVFAALIAATTLPAAAQTTDNIPAYARRVIDLIAQRAGSCGVSFVVAPPNRVTPADYVAVSRDQRVIAHIIDRPGYFAARYPLGGNNHSIDYDWERLGFFTPFGKVAGANRYTDGWAWYYNYYCRSQPVHGFQFDQCVEQGFVQVLVARLCNS